MGQSGRVSLLIKMCFLGKREREGILKVDLLKILIMVHSMFSGFFPAEMEQNNGFLAGVSIGGGQL